MEIRKHFPFFTALASLGILARAGPGENEVPFGR